MSKISALIVGVGGVVGLVSNMLWMPNTEAHAKEGEQNTGVTNAANIKIRNVDTYPKLPLTNIEYPSNLQLIQVQVAFRHGDRAPIWMPVSEDETNWMCEDEQDPTKKKPCYPGQLSPVGKLQLTRLGQYLHDTYIERLKFLHKHYQIPDIHVQSTDVPRTKQSVTHLLSALYPPEVRNGQGINFLIRRTSEEILYPDYGQCPKLKEFYWSYRNTAEYIKSAEKDQLLKTELASWFNVPNHKGRKPGLTDLFDYFTCLTEHGRPLPEGVTMEQVNKLNEMTIRHWWSPLRNHEGIKRLGIGRMIQEMMTHMNKAREGQSYKIVLYSGHDSTIGPLLTALDVHRLHWPHYASYVIFELFQEKANPKQHLVRVIYNGKVYPLPCALKEKDPTFCPFDKFAQYVEPMIPKDWIVECEVKQGQQDNRSFDEKDED